MSGVEAVRQLSLYAAAVCAALAAALTAWNVLFAFYGDALTVVLATVTESWP